MSTINTMYPRLVVSDGAKAIDFYVAALGAKQGERHVGDNDKIVHAELTIGDGITIALKDEGDGDPAPTSLGGSPVILALDVDDADALGEAMVAAGATVIYPIQDWGLRQPRRPAGRPVRAPLDDLSAAELTPGRRRPARLHANRSGPRRPARTLWHAGGRRTCLAVR